MLEEQVRILKLENKKLQEKRKAQLNVIEISFISQKEKKHGMIGSQSAKRIEKFQVVETMKFQNSKTCILIIT